MKMLFRSIAFALILASSALALDIRVHSAKEQGELFSTVHLRYDDNFTCKEFTDTFEVVTRIECVFTKAPTKTFTPIKNQFFSMQSHETASTYVISITPLFKIKLFAVASHLSTRRFVASQDVSHAQHYMIVGYKDSMPIIKPHTVPQEGIAFPIQFFKDTLPFIGALGLDGNPLEFDEIEEVSDYMNIRKLYEQERYDKVLAQIQKAEASSKVSIFQSEYLLYKIRTAMKLDEPGMVGPLGKEFLRLYSTDEAVPEVLLHLADAAQTVGMTMDANYFYDRLLSEHYESNFATQALIDLGKHSLSRGDTKKAAPYLIRALEKAKTIDLASQAALALAQLNVSEKEPQKVVYYIDKIAQANSEYLEKHFDSIHDDAKNLALINAPKQAAEILNKVLRTLDETDDRYKEALYNLAKFYDEANDNAQAYETYKEYLTKYEYSKNAQEVQKRMDEVLFEMGDDNTTKRLALYSDIKKRYDGQEIAQKALFEKVKLLYELGRFDEVLAHKESLNALDTQKYPNAASIIDKAAAQLAAEHLKANMCQEALLLSKAYDLNISYTNSQKMYHCAMQESEYAYASALTKPHIRDENLQRRAAWMYRHIQAKAKEGDIKDVFVLGNDLLTLASMQGTKAYDDILYELFESAILLNKRQESIEYIKRIEDSFGLKFKDIELYNKMARMAKAHNDDTMIVTYASKVIALQKKHNSFTQSPQIEFLLLQALKRTNQDKKAYELLKSLSAYVTKSKDQARALYELGAMAQKLNKHPEAKQAYKKSAQITPPNEWSTLSQDALDVSYDN